MGSYSHKSSIIIKQISNNRYCFLYILYTHILKLIAIDKEKLYLNKINIINNLLVFTLIKIKNVIAHKTIFIYSNKCKCLQIYFTKIACVRSWITLKCLINEKTAEKLYIHHRKIYLNKIENLSFKVLEYKHE